MLVNYKVNINIICLHNNWNRNSLLYPQKAVMNWISSMQRGKMHTKLWLEILIGKITRRQKLKCEEYDKMYFRERDSGVVGSVLWFMIVFCCGPLWYSDNLSVSIIRLSFVVSRIAINYSRRSFVVSQSVSNVYALLNGYFKFV